MKETKNVLTKADIQKELKAKILVSVPARVIILFLGILLALLEIPMASEFLTEKLLVLSEWTALDVLITVLVGLNLLVFMLPLLLGLFLTYDLISQLLRIQKGDFTVYQDELAEMEEMEVRRIGGKIRLENVFYFLDSGRYVVTAADGSAFSYSNRGDRFYVVSYYGKKPKPMLVYNTKIYEYRER